MIVKTERLAPREGADDRGYSIARGASKASKERRFSNFPSVIDVIQQKCCLDQCLRTISLKEIEQYQCIADERRYLGGESRLDGQQPGGPLMEENAMPAKSMDT